MKHIGKGRLHATPSQGLSPSMGIANGFALSIGIWCTIASIWLLFH